jgi:hypothetical protein
MPDYGYITVPVFPFVGITLTLDRAGNAYAGPSVGVNLPGLSGKGYGAGWTGDKCKPNSEQLQNFLNGWAFNVGVGLGATSSGLGVPGAGPPESTGLNLQTPGLSEGYNFPVGNVGIKW